MITKRSCVRVKAQYGESRIPEYKDNPIILAYGDLPPILDEDLFDLLKRTPDFKASERRWKPEERLHLLPRVRSIVYPNEATKRAFRKMHVMVRQGHVERNPLDGSFKQKMEFLDDLPKDLRDLDLSDRPRNNSLNGLITGLSGTGKSTIIELFNDSISKGVLVHSEFRGHPMDGQLHIPSIVIECDPKMSLNGLLEALLTEIGRLTGEKNLLAECPKNSKNGKPTLHELIPFTVRQLLLHNVGMLIIDEAEYITAQFNNGDAAMVFVWINLMNVSGVPLVLVANPEIEQVFKVWLKASMRFSAGLRLKLQPLPVGEEFNDFCDALEEYQWTKKPTVLTEEFRKEFHYHTQGILRYMLDVWHWVQHLTISRGGDEKITIGLLQEAIKENAHEVDDIITAMRSRDVKKLKHYRDVGSPLPPVHSSTKPPVPPKNSGKGKAPKKTMTIPPKPRLGPVPAEGYMDCNSVKVRGEYSRHAFIKEYFKIPDSTDLYLS